MGIEPTTFCLGSRHSTTELRPLAGYGVGLCMRRSRGNVKARWLPVFSLTYMMDGDGS